MDVADGVDDRIGQVDLDASTPRRLSLRTEIQKTDQPVASPMLSGCVPTPGTSMPEKHNARRAFQFPERCR
jgi:hypothetical protein